MGFNPHLIKLNNQLIDITTPIVMGVVNVSPDSFYIGNRFSTDKGILQCVERILTNGGTIVDIGGYSTRPGAEQISHDEELKRVSESLIIILKKFPNAIISVDTFRSSVVRELVRNFPIAMVNDIGGGTLDDLMFQTIADLKLAYVLMHTRGNPQTMQNNTDYDNIIADVLHFLEKRLAQLRLLGVNDVICDLGFGFAKTLDQNYSLLKNMHIFKEMNVPILAGVSRKSMIYKTLNTTADKALNGTTAANMLALLGGASILRVHDVKEAMEAISIYTKFKNC
jgi:dihydropteroate synthase